jgi:phosphatidylserine synthase
MKNKSLNVGNKLIYTITRPILILAIKMNLSPNFITTLSLIFSIASLLLAITFQNITIYIVCNIISVLLDYVDGPLARSTKRTRKSEFRYDHYSDLIKINIFVFSIAFFYDDKLFNTISQLFIILFLLFTILNHDHYDKKNRKKVENQERSPVNKKKHPFIRLITEFDGPMYLLLILSSVNRNLLIFMFVYNSILFVLYIAKISHYLLKTRI